MIDGVMKESTMPEFLPAICEKSLRKPSNNTLQGKELVIQLLSVSYMSEMKSSNYQINLNTKAMSFDTNSHVAHFDEIFKLFGIYVKK